MIKHNKTHKSFPTIKPKCKYFGRCGGCDLQDISYQNQLKFKNKIIKDFIVRASLDCRPACRQAGNYLDILPGSDSQYFYRNSIRFEFLKVDGQLKIARHNYLDSSKPVVTDYCLLQSEFSNKLLSEILDLYNKLDYQGDDLWQVKIREGKQTGEFMLEMITMTSDLPFKSELISLLKKYPQVKSVYQTIAPNKDVYKLSRRLIHGRPVIYEKIGHFTFQISPESFFQTNSLGVERLYNIIKEFADIKIGDSVLDLYSGTGSIGIYLSTLAKEVIGVESVPEAVRDAKDNAKINKINNIEFICADVSKWLKTNIRQKFDKIIIDPPRAGLSKNLIFDISHSDFDILVYVSCNPMTFFRDLKLLSKSFDIKNLQPIDMFPQTCHIELVAQLIKKF